MTTRLLCALLLLAGVPVAAQMPAGMEHCVFPPQLGCPHTKSGLPGDAINALCQRLVDNGSVSRDACWDFVWQHTCAELLDLQIRDAKNYGGDCYGILLHNCCPASVYADISLDPVLRADHEPSAVVMFTSAAKQTMTVNRERREYLLESGSDLTVLWIDSHDQYNIPGAALRWQVHGVRAAAEQGESDRSASARPTDARVDAPYREVAYSGTEGEAFSINERTELRRAGRQERICAC